MSIFDGQAPGHDALTLFIMQVLLIVVLCRTLAYLFGFLKQPPVIAEVIAGILLGPSAIGRSAVFENYLFAKSSLGILKTFADIGLIVFMFLVGLELDANILKRNARNSVLISVVAMVLPFGLGLAASLAVYNTQFEDGAQPPFSSFLLFVAVALSITAFPVLARILAETRMLDDRVGNIALSSAAVDDVVAWCLLALVVAIARATNPLTALWTFMALFGFIAFMLFGMRRLLIRVARKSRQNQSLKLHVIALFLGLMLLCAWFTEIIGVHSIFGAFLLGVITPRENRFALDITERIEDLVVILLLPLYFTYSGLNTDLGSINNALTGGLTVLIIVTACAGKIIGATLAAKFCKNTWRESFTVGILMNTKGLVELIVLNLGLQVGVLNQKIFTMFVVMAIVTTCITTPLVHFIYLRHRKLNAHPKENYQLVLFSADQKNFNGHGRVCSSHLTTQHLYNQSSDFQRN
jgi:Kef-type K+ transport system membrane component KefB